MIGNPRKFSTYRLFGSLPPLVTRLADHFGTTVSFLVGEDIESLDADNDLQRMFRQASALDQRERAILDGMMKTLLAHRLGK